MDEINFNSENSENNENNESNGYSYDAQSGSYDAYSQQKMDSQPQYDYSSYVNTDEGDKKANTVKTLGIVSIIVSVVVGLCCCVFAGPVVGIVGLVKAGNIPEDTLSDAGKENLRIGKILCIIGIAAAGLIFIVNLIINTAMGTSAEMTEQLMEILENYA